MRKNGKAIQSSEKDFYGRGGLYQDAIQAFNEFLVNGLFAAGSTQVKMEKFQHEGVSCFAIVNDGEFFNQAALDEAITRYGCESANTAGNQNGAGMKMAAAYFINKNPNSFMVVVSKSNDGRDSYGLIGPNGEVYCSYQSLDVSDQDYIKFITKRFLDSMSQGTVVSVFNASHLDEFNINKYSRVLVEEFTSALQKVKFTLVDGDDKIEVVYQDLFYGQVDPEGNDKSLRWKKNVCFTFNGKFYRCDLEVFNGEHFENKYSHDLKCQYDIDSEGQRADYKMWGVVAGYDNGYTPLYAGKLWLIGKEPDGHFTRLRCRLVAITDDADPLYAGIKDWQDFFKEWGHMNQAKIQTPRPCGKIARRKGKDIVAQNDYKDFKEKVIDPMEAVMNAWRHHDANEVPEAESTVNVLNADMSIRHPIFVGGEQYKVKFMNSSDSGKYISCSFTPEDGYVIALNAQHPGWSPFIGERVSPVLKEKVSTLKQAIQAVAGMDPKVRPLDAINKFFTQFNVVV